MLELAGIERRGDLFTLLSLLAGRTGGLLAPAAPAGQSGIPRTTLVRPCGDAVLTGATRTNANDLVIVAIR